MQIPFERLLPFCRTDQAAYQICTDARFWEARAQHDLGISPNEYRRAPGRPIEKYLQFRDKMALLREIFNLGMYIRGWSGPGTTYPTDIQYCAAGETNALVAIARIYEMINGLSPRAKLDFEQLQAVDRDHRPTRRSLKNVLDLISSGQGCSRHLSDILIATPLYYGLVV